MSRARHKRASGGATPMWVAGNPKVKKEAEERANGGKVVPVKAHHRMHGGAVKARADRPARKRGGGVGADKSPFSSAKAGHSNDPAGSSNPTDTYGGTPSD